MKNLRFSHLTQTHLETGIERTQKRNVNEIKLNAKC